MKKEKELPNLLLFIADEMRGDAASLGGKFNKIIKTPNIDSLLNGGAAFTNCFTVNPVCAPSRCCMFTGQYPHNGHRSLYQLLRPHEENLFRLLKNKGYEVVWVGRNDFINKDAIKGSFTKRISIMRELSKIKMKENPFPIDHPLRKSFYYGKRSKEEARDYDSVIVEKALNYLDNEHNKPYCLYVAAGFPHPPYTVEEPYFSMYDREKIPSPIPRKSKSEPEYMSLMHEKYGLNQLTDDDFREIISTYYGMISRLDDKFGQILNKMKEIGDYDDSAIIFFSDHGDYAGDYGLTEKWPVGFQDCLIKIPLILKIPKLTPKNQIFHQLVESIDIFPTILEIADITTPYTHFGSSLVPLLTGEIKVHRDCVFAEGGYDPKEPQCFENVVNSPEIPLIGIYHDKTTIPKLKPSTVTRSAMIRNNEWKLIIRNDAQDELYDMQSDPQELYNLIENEGYSKIISELKEKLLKWYLITSDNPHWERKRHI